MRIVLTLIAVKMLTLPYLKLVGGVALLYIGVNLLSEDDDEHDARGQADRHRGGHPHDPHRRPRDEPRQRAGGGRRGARATRCC